MSVSPGSSRESSAFDAGDEASAPVWMARGARSAISIPALILSAAFIGYAGLARESGLTFPQTLLMTGLVWALPSIVVLTGAISSGMGLVPAALAVALASVRLMPMTMSLIPMVRVEGRTRRWHLFYISHFIAVTAWVHAMRHMPDIPRQSRLPFFAGFGTALTSFVTCVTGVAYLLVDKMPPAISAALLLLTPVYFVCSLWGASQLSSDKASMLIGLMLGPVFYLWLPGLDLLWTGLVGGTLAYGITRFMRRGVM